MNDPYLTDWTRHQHDLDNGKRAAYIAGLRMLADKLEAHEDIPLPYQGTFAAIMISFLSGDNPRAAMAATARAIPCSWQKHPREYADGTAYFDLDGELAGLKVQLTAYRDEVCTRVVTGTEDREVEEVVTPAVTRMVTKEVPVVEWRCESVLAPRETTGAAA